MSEHLKLATAARRMVVDLKPANGVEAADLDLHPVPILRDVEYLVYLAKQDLGTFLPPI
jgi:hypothetical protein